MDKKLFIYSLGAVLAILFLSTIGTLYTGYAVLPQSDLSLKQYPFPFLKYGSYNDLYIVISDGATIDELDAASNIAQNLKGSLPKSASIVTVSKAPDGDHNFILLGDPCTNKLMADVLKTNDCNPFNLNNGEGLLLLKNSQRTSTLIVSGYDLQGILKASKVLSNYNTFPLKENKVIVSGNLNKLLSLSLKY